MGRFCERGEDADMSAAIFHEQCAAELGIKEAIVTLASIHLGLPHELLVNVYLEVSGGDCGATRIFANYEYTWNDCQWKPACWYMYSVLSGLQIIFVENAQSRHCSNIAHICIMLHFFLCS